MTRVEELEKLLQTDFRKRIWRPFTEALNLYKLLDPGDRIAVGLSGGKDSVLLYLLLRALQRHSRFPFELCAIAMDPGYSEAHRAQLQGLCSALEIPVDLFCKPIFQASEKAAIARNDSPCFLCARMRRGALYERAQTLGANKLALGHHQDDIIETVLLNLLYAGNFMTMMPKIPADHFETLTLIRPLYLLDEEDIRDFICAAGLTCLDCACSVAAKKTASKRRDVKTLLKTLETTCPGIRRSIFRSTQNVHLDAILGYTQGDRQITFDDIFQQNVSRKNAKDRA